jgi:hypothetical protein
MSTRQVEVRIIATWTAAFKSSLTSRQSLAASLLKDETWSLARQNDMTRLGELIDSHPEHISHAVPVYLSVRPARVAIAIGS